MDLSIHELLLPEMITKIIRRLSPENIISLIKVDKKIRSMIFNKVFIANYVGCQWGLHILLCYLARIGELSLFSFIVKNELPLHDRVNILHIEGRTFKRSYKNAVSRNNLMTAKFIDTHAVNTKLWDHRNYEYNLEEMIVIRYKIIYIEHNRLYTTYDNLDNLCLSIGNLLSKISPHLRNTYLEKICAKCKNITTLNYISTVIKNVIREHNYSPDNFHQRLLNRIWKNVNVSLLSQFHKLGFVTDYDIHPDRFILSRHYKRPLDFDIPNLDDECNTFQIGDRQILLNYINKFSPLETHYTLLSSYKTLDTTEFIETFNKYYKYYYIEERGVESEEGINLNNDSNLINIYNFISELLRSGYNYLFSEYMKCKILIKTVDDKYIDVPIKFLYIFRLYENDVLYEDEEYGKITPKYSIYIKNDVELKGLKPLNIKRWYVPVGKILTDDDIKILDEKTIHFAKDDGWM